MTTQQLTSLLGVELPIVQAPMAGASGSALAIAAARAGALGSLPGAMLTADALRAETAAFRSAIDAPVNLNFFCHAVAGVDADRERAWADRLDAIADADGFTVDRTQSPATRGSMPFDADTCAVVEELHPHVVSFHFGLPEPSLVDRLRTLGIVVMSSATTVAEARWLQVNGCDVVIAQGAEAGGHRGVFLDADAPTVMDVATQVGTMALVPQVVDAIDLPVIAAGAITDARGVAAARALGASGVQCGTAFLLCPEALTGALHRAVLQSDRAERTALTNVFTGRPARSMVNAMVSRLGPLAADAPAFPRATDVLRPVRAAAERAGSSDFGPLWAGQSAPLAVAISAADVVARLAQGLPPG